MQVLPNSFAVAALALVLGAIPVLAATDMDPTGRWETENGQSRYDVFICGDHGELCGRLVWLKDGPQNNDNQALMGTLILDHAKHTAINRWRGTIAGAGKSATGILTLVDDKTLKLTGCTGPACGSFDLHKLAQ